MAKGHKKRKTTVNIPICIAGILLCLTLLSIHFMSGLYARYTTSSSGQDSARVIKFGDITLSEIGDFSNFEGQAFLAPGVDLKKKVTVDFSGSESSVYVFIEVSLSSHWNYSDHKKVTACNGKIQWEVADGWKYLPTSDTGKCIYYKELEPNEKMTAVDFIKNEGKITVSGEITRTEFATLDKMQIDLRALVAQSNGFAGVTEAWTSISAN